jgi:hypothetical protein
MFNIDWEQYKKNLKLEREEWDKFANYVENLKRETDAKINELRMLRDAEVKRVNDEFERKKKLLECRFKRKSKIAHDKYIRNVEKKFKADVTV